MHIVFVVKYRRKIFDGKAIERLNEMFYEICLKNQCNVVEMDGEKDHVHLLVDYPSKVCLATLVNQQKGISSKTLRSERKDIAKRFWKNVLWSPSYFAVFCGGAPIEIIKQYIEQQSTPLQKNVCYPSPP